MTVRVNSRTYGWPRVPAVVICLDGCEPAYLDAAIARGLMPTLARMRATGTDRIAHSVIPSFTNPNNLSIATGAPPSVHGICGNYLFDPATRTEVMMNDVRFLRAPTLFSAFQAAGAKVGIVTAKDKLRALLGAGLRFDGARARCFSAERCDRTTLADHGQHDAAGWLGLPVPDVYSAALSEWVLAAGLRLLRDWQPDILYLTTTDYIQHKHAPDAPQSLDFHAMVDRYLTGLDATGAVIAVTADHGMKPKHDADGAPNVLYVQDLLDGWLGPGQARVILPITDPYVVHHGALGSFATVYLPDGTDSTALAARLAALPGMMEVTTRPDAALRHNLPPDRIGDIVLISTENMTLGTSAHRHDLAALDEPLRSHGGLTEQAVPFILNRPADLPHAPALRNFDAFFHATHAAAKAPA